MLTGPMPSPSPGALVIASVTNRLAPRAAGSGVCPSAILAVNAAEKTQPEPWVERVLILS
jgi:hypothetical protein